MRNMKEEYQRIGKRIRVLRMNRGMNQMEFAKRLGIVQAGLSAMEHGKNPTTLRRLFQMSDVLGCSMREFFEEEKPVESGISIEEVVEAMQIVKKIKLAKAKQI